MRIAGARSSSAATGSGVGQGGVRRGGEAVEVLDVRAQQVGGAGEVLGHARPELGLEQRQHVLPDPRAGEAGVVVGRVGPPGDVLSPAGLLGLRAGEAEQRPAEDPERAAHAGQRASAAAAGQPEQDGLGLVVEGVPEQHRRGAEPVGDLLEDGVPGLPRRRLETLPVGLDADPDRRGLVGAEGGHLADDAGGHLGRRIVQAVVDGDADDRPGLLAGLEDGRGEQGEGVGATGAGDQDGRGAGVAEGEVPSYGEPGGRDGGVGTRSRGDSAA